MAHAEKCPVCDGEGKLVGLLPEDKVACYGCSGKGWVEVGVQDYIWVEQTHWPVPVYNLDTAGQSHNINTS